MTRYFATPRITVCFGGRPPHEQEGPQRARHLHQVHQPRRQAGRLGRDDADPRGGQPSPRAESSFAASWSPAARPSAPTTSFTTSPTSRSPSSRPRTTTTASATGCSRPSNMPTTLNIPFVFSSNGDGFVFHDRTGHQRREGSHSHARRVPVARQTSGRNTAPGRD